MVDVNQSSNEKNEKNEKTKESINGSFLSSVIKFVFWLVISSALLWNWDGFWQTDIKSLNKVQKNFFPSKYSEEQLKVSRITRNNNLIDDIRKRLERAENRANGKIEKARGERDQALSELEASKSELNRYLEKENTKCRYYDTSLRMIDHLTNKYSEDELKRTLSCTSAECEKILHYRQEATAICD
ncbi:hypothetical protein [Pseudoalteromonas sp. SG43-3]|uniref:hypothetical protein n=1 Tax=Pseudoalteromonas sp. SG43-3 TaxID=2760970 RepID=UPI001601A9EC|nr:hypothetical protein [Pseudoalteromonas sp. SG43-3]MBB1443026.1 hypothetical protein [Pseudoalteromonas sp. SG43-3]